METAKQLAGFSPAEADDLRKAIGKKIHELMASAQDKFLEGCAQNESRRGREPALEEHRGVRRTTRSTSRTRPAMR